MQRKISIVYSRIWQTTERAWGLTKVLAGGMFEYKSPRISSTTTVGAVPNRLGIVFRLA